MNKAKIERAPQQYNAKITEESCSQSVPKHPRTDEDDQQGQYELKLFPKIDFDEEIEEYKKINQTAQSSDTESPEDRDGFFQLESRGSMKSAQ